MIKVKQQPEIESGWRKSQFCTASGCVEVARRGSGTILVRDSKDASRELLEYTISQWNKFLVGSSGQLGKSRLLVGLARGETVTIDLGDGKVFVQEPITWPGNAAGDDGKYVSWRVQDADADAQYDTAQLPMFTAQEIVAAVRAMATDTFSPDTLPLAPGLEVRQRVYAGC